MHLLILWRKKKKLRIRILCRHEKMAAREKRGWRIWMCSLHHAPKSTNAQRSVSFQLTPLDCRPQHNVTLLFLSLLSRLENKGMEGCECRRLKKRNAVLKKKEKKQQHRIGFEISTLEIKSEALSAAGSMLQLVAFVEMTQHTEDTAKKYSGDRTRQDSEDKTFKYSTSLSSHYTSLYRSA